MQLVTHPMTFEYHHHTMPWIELTSKAISLGYRSHKTSTRGLHVHVNRTAFGCDKSEQDAVISRILFFIERFWQEMLRFSRRTESQINRWAARYGIKDNPKQVMDNAKTTGKGRYACINLCNYYTIEFRIITVTIKRGYEMRKLTLLGFLCEYVKSLSENNTLNIHKLTSEIYNGNHRLKEPLFLYCYYSDKADILLKYISEDDNQEFQAISVNIKKNAPLPTDYMKVLNSYKCRIGMKENDEHIKALMIDKIIKLKETKHISNYRIYTELGINAGNFNDFVKNRNLTRLSLNKSREVYNYLQNL